MRATSRLVRLYIRRIAADATAAAADLYDTLESDALARLAVVEKGKVLIGVTSGGTSSTYTLAPLGDLSAQDIAEVASAVLDAADVLIAADDDIDDSALKTALLALWPAGGIKGFSNNFRGLASGSRVTCS